MIYQDALNNLLQFVHQDSLKVMVLMGNAGVGKTFLCNALIEHLEKEPSVPVIPVYIDLLDSQNQPDDLIEHVAKIKNRQPGKGESCPKMPSYIFIFDHWGECGKLENLYHKYQMNQLPAKAIVICRLFVLDGCLNEYAYFAPLSPQGIHKEQVTSLQLPGFKAEDIKKLCSAATYTTLLQHPLLLQLAQSPLILKFINEEVELLNSSEELLENILNKWFTWYKEKYHAMGLLADLPMFKDPFWQYCHELAKQMQHNKSVILYYPPTTNKLERNKDAMLIKLVCPLIVTEKYQYRWLADGLVDYFASLTLNQSFQTKANQKTYLQEESIQSPNPLNYNSINQAIITQRLMTNEVEMMQMYADLAIENKDYKSYLFKLVFSSRNNPSNQIAAANAMTALNYAKVPFSGMDLSGICIAHANLEEGLFDSTQLSYSDLRYVNLRSAWLRNTNFEKANMEGIQFGELPYLKLPQKILAWDFFSDECLLIATKNDKKDYKHVLLLSEQDQSPEKIDKDTLILQRKGTTLTAYWNSNDLVVENTKELGNDIDDFEDFFYENIEKEDFIDKLTALFNCTRNIKRINFYQVNIETATLTTDTYLSSIKSNILFSGKLFINGLKDLLIHYDDELHIVKIWKISTGKEVNTILIEKDHSPQKDIILSPDGGYLAISCLNYILCFSAITGNLLGTLKILPNGLIADLMQFSAQGAFLAVVYRDYNWVLWDVKKSVISYSVQIKERKATQPTRISIGNSHLALSQNMHFFAYNESGSTALTIWSIQEQKLLHTLFPANVNYKTVKTSIFSPCSQYIAVSFDNSVIVFEVLTGQQIANLEREENVWEIKFSKNSKKIITQNEYEYLRFWDYSLWKVKTNKNTTSNNAELAILQPNNTNCLVTTQDGNASFWCYKLENCFLDDDLLALPITPIECWEKQYTWWIDNWQVSCMAFSQDGKYLALAGVNSPVVTLLQVPSLRSKEFSRRYLYGDFHIAEDNVEQYSGKNIFPGYNIYSMCFFKHYLFALNTEPLSVPNEYSIHVWDLNQTDRKAPILCTSKKQSTILCPVNQSYNTNVLFISDSYNGCFSSTMPPNSNQFNLLGIKIIFNPTKPIFAYTEEENQIVIMECFFIEKMLSTIKQIGMLNIPKTASRGDMLFTANGKHLIVTYDNVIKRFAMKNYEEISFPEIHAATINYISLSPAEQRFLLSVDRQGIICIWDFSARQCIYRSTALLGKVIHSIHWKIEDDKLFFISTSDDKVARYWQILRLNENLPSVILVWTSCQTNLVADGANIAEIINLNLDNQILLNQLGALDSSELSKNKYQQGGNLLHTAVHNNELIITSKFLEYGTPIDTINDEGETALHIAARKGYLNISHVLLVSKAKLTIKDKFGCTPLHYAAMEGHIEIVKIMLHYNMHKAGNTSLYEILDTKDSKFGNTPLHYAAQNGFRKIVRLLLQAGASQDIINTEQFTPYQLASKNNYTDIAQSLKEAEEASDFFKLVKKVSKAMSKIVKVINPELTEKTTNENNVTDDELSYLEEEDRLSILPQSSQQHANDTPDIPFAQKGGSCSQTDLMKAQGFFKSTQVPTQILGNSEDKNYPPMNFDEETYNAIEEDELSLAIKQSLQANQSSSLREDLEMQAKKFGFDCHDVARTGNCFFEAISDQLTQIGQSIMHQELRQRTAQHLTDYWYKYDEDYEEGAIQQIIQKTALAGTWSNEIDITALARELNMTIVIINSDGSKPIIKRMKNAQAILYLGYEVNQHYQSLHRNPKLVLIENINSYILNAEIDLFERLEITESSYNNQIYNRHF